MTLPSSLILAKNALAQTGAFLELLEHQMADGTINRWVNNSEDIFWNGNNWEKFHFQYGDYEESSEGDLPEVVILVSNVMRVVSDFMDSASNGLLGDTVIYRQVHSDNLGEVTPAIEAEFEILDADEKSDQWVQFTLGLENLFLQRFPQDVYRRNQCNLKPWMTHICGYVASSSCDRAFATCITLHSGNLPFDGFPGIPGGAWVAS